MHESENIRKLWITVQYPIHQVLTIMISFMEMPVRKGCKEYKNVRTLLSELSQRSKSMIVFHGQSASWAG